MLKGLCAAAVVFILVLGTMASIAAAGESSSVSDCCKILKESEKGEKDDEAAQCFKKVLTKESNNPLALNNMAFILVRKKQCEGALQYLKKARDHLEGYKIEQTLTVLVARCNEKGNIFFFYAVAPLEKGNKEGRLEEVIDANIYSLEKETKSKSTPSKKGKK